MDTQTLSHWKTVIFGYIQTFGVTIVEAILFWFVGRWLIGVAVRIVRGALDRQKVDPTLVRYLGSIVTAALNLVLVMGILGFFGIQTTTFAALIGGAGVAIGMAWSGLLSNFAAGAFLIVLRPFKVGDFVATAGTVGTVTELGLFATAITTPDNVFTLVGNSKIFADTIQNFTHNPTRRVELKAQLSGAADHRAAIELLKRKLAEIPNVAKLPAPEVSILDLNLVGPVLAVRPHCHNDHYWQVYFDTNAAIKEALAAGGFPAPMPAQAVIVTQNHA